MRVRAIAIAASLAWIVVAILLASSSESETIALRLYCRLTSDPTCIDTMYLVVHWPAIATIALGPVALGWLLTWGLLALKRRRET